MRLISKEALEALRGRYPAGSRVELIRMNDRYAPPIGALGTVQGVDDIGTVHVAWDNGSGLGAAYGEDEIRPVASITFDPSDWAGIHQLMEQYGDTATPFSGTNEDGEGILISITHESVHVTTFQHNRWIRENTYWSDYTVEETFSGKRR